MSTAVVLMAAGKLDWFLPQALHVLLLSDAWYWLHGGQFNNQSLSKHALEICVRNHGPQGVPDAVVEL